MGVRSAKGQGSIEQIGDKWKVVVSGINPATGKRERLSRTFDTQREAVQYRPNAETELQQKFKDDQRKLKDDQAGLVRPDTAQAWLDQWLEIKKPILENGSWTWYEKSVRRHLKPVLNGIKLQELDQVHVLSLMAKMERNGVSAYGRRAALTTLRAACNSAVELELLKSNPTGKIKKPKSKRREPRWWSAEEGAAFLAARAVESHRLFALFRLALDSGMRLGELFGLRWSDIDLDKREVRVRRSLEEVDGVRQEKDTKTKAGRRTVVVGQATVEAMQGHRELMLEEERDVTEGVVFVNEVGDWLDKPNFHKLFVRLTRRAGIAQIRPYDLRHSAASMLLRAGASLAAVAVRLGHSDPGMTLRVYAHCLPCEQGALADLSAKLLGKGPEKA